MATTVSQDSMTVARNATFQDRVNYFMKKAAVAILAEANTTPSHALRVTYANKVLAGTASVIDYAIAVTTNATVAAAGFSVIDSDLEFTINSMVNAFAGVST